MRRVLWIACVVVAMFVASDLCAQVPDLEECSSPGQSFGGVNGDPSQISDTITVGAVVPIADVHVNVDITHTFVGDIDMSLTHQGTTVGLHATAGAGQDDLRLTFRDGGVPYNSEPFDCQCSMAPSGPGSLADFSATTSDGDWTLDIVDNDPTLDDGVLLFWCLRVFQSAPPRAPQPVSNLLCFSPPGSGFGQVAWSLFQLYDEIQVSIDGTVAATLPGNATTYATPALSIPSVVEIGIQGMTAGGPAPMRTCMVSIQDQVDLEECSSPGTLVSEIFPVIDAITVSEVRPIGDIQVQVDVTHTFDGDLLVDVTSPANTTVRVHDGGGTDQQNLDLTFWDFGIPNGSLPYSCECEMQPSGPGSLVDFTNELTLGDWRLSIVDQFAGDFGTLNEWCIRTFDNMPVFAVDDLTCQMGTEAGVVDLSWTHPTDHEDVQIFVDGVLQAVLSGPFAAGTTGTYSTIPFAGPQLTQICVIPMVSGLSGPQQCCSIDVSAPTVKDLTWDTVPGSGIVDLTWDNPLTYDSIQIYLDDVFLVNLPGTATNFSTAAMPVPGSGRLCIEGTLSSFGVSNLSCVPYILLPVVDIQECSSPNLFISDTQPPSVDSLVISGNDLIMDLEVSISLSHTFVGDLDVDLASPSGTVVRLHDQGGGLGDDLLVQYTDTGVVNGTVPFNCGCAMQPAGFAGVGSLADFAQEPAGGAWSLSVTDNLAEDNGTLHRWCVRVPTACSLVPPADLTCDVSNSDVLLNWTNSDTYSEIEVLRNDLVVANLSGSAVSYIDTGASPGVNRYRLRVGQAGLTCMSLTLPCDIAFGITDIVYRGELPSQIDSAGSLVAALENDGRIVLLVRDFTTASLSPPESDLNAIWLTLGSFPDNHQLTEDEGALLTAFHLGDRNQDGTPESPPLPIYLEGGDVWGFDPPTEFTLYDGIQDGPIADGDDSLDFLFGQDSGQGLDLSGGVWDAVYNQDQAGIDYNDQLFPAAAPPDQAGANVGVIWIGGQSGANFATGVFYNSNIRPVISQSFEFGGYAGDQNALAALYGDALNGDLSPTPDGDDFLRGDLDQDGALIINDPILILDYLFVNGTGDLPCFDAADVNDDGTVGIADVIFELGYLFFAPGSAPPPAPGPSICGPDPTPDDLAECEFVCP